MLKPTFSLAVAVCLGLGTVPVTAQDLEARTIDRANQNLRLDAMTLKRMDTDKNGVISRAEFLRRVPNEAAWRTRDTNQDGILDEGEQQATLELAPRTQY